MWGLWDEPFLDFFADKLKVFPQPFMAAVFTLSSHHPFEVPEKYKGVFPKGTIPIHQTIGYADYSLRKFFSKISEMPWFSNTLFVITADHTNEKALKEYRTAYGQFSIPIAFYMKGSKLKGTADRIAQQIDIMPSVLDYLNYDNEYIAFGNSVFDSVPEPFGFNTFGSTYYIFLRNHMLESTGLTSRSLYDFKNDRLLEHNLVATDTVLKNEMERRLKAVVQVYNRRLSENDLTVKND
jgi:phosphoglycerol transferase MdoB-like AlkP superfamily enzyme